MTVINPFRAEHADPWASDFCDVESLNAKASDAIHEAVTGVRSTTRGGGVPRSSVITILGPAGAGKTHLFLRLRRKCGPRAAFVLLRPDLAAAPTPRHVLLSVSDSLKHPASASSDAQLDLVVASFLTEVDVTDAKWPSVLLSQYRDSKAQELDALIEAGIDLLEQRFSGDVSTDYLELLLRAPFLKGADRRSALTWLSGREPTEAHLKRLGRTQPLSEADIVPALRTLSLVASFGAPVVLVFDQLENLIEPGGEPQRIVGHANLVAELFDNTRGVVVVQLALDAEWRRRIRPALSDAVRSRLERQLLDLELPNPNQKEELVQEWVQNLPEEDRGGPFPYPFTPGQLEAWRNTPGLTPRRLMIACREVLDGAPLTQAPIRRDDSNAVELGSFSPEPQAPETQAIEQPAAAAPPTDAEERALEADRMAQRLEQLWQAHVRTARSELREVAQEGRPLDAERLMSGVLAGVRMPAGVEVTSRTVKGAPELRLSRQGSELSLLGLQHGHPSSVLAALNQLRGLAQERRLIAVRQRDYEFPPTWKAVNAAQRALAAAPGAELCWLAGEDVAQLLALHDFQRSARSQDVDGLDGVPIPESDVSAWLQHTLDWQSWELVKRVVTALGGPESNEAEEAGPGGLEADPTPEEVSRVRGGGASVEEVASRPAHGGALKSKLSIPEVTEAAGSSACSVLGRLRFASVERLVREVRAANPQATRAAVLEELRGAGAAVVWYGRSLVSVAELAPPDVNRTDTLGSRASAQRGGR